MRALGHVSDKTSAAHILIVVTAAAALAIAIAIAIALLSMFFWTVFWMLLLVSCNVQGK